MKSGRSSISPFTYFKDTDGYIFYASGPEEQASETVRSILVYVPCAPKYATKVHPYSQTYYKKCLAHGYRSELLRLQEELDRSSYIKISNLCSSDTTTGEEFLIVPRSSIVEWYDSKEALRDILQDNRHIYPASVRSAVLATISLFNHAGIQTSRLGIYGGLQCGLIPTNGLSLNDVDVVVYGVDAYPIIVNLAKYNSTLQEFTSFIAEDPIRRAEALRRGQLSQFRLPHQPHTPIDARIIRTDNDPKVSLPQAARDHREITLRGARVTQASGSLSFPITYEVLDSDHKQWNVITNLYQHIGAATVDDIVELRGLAYGSTILLSNPSKHYIYCSELSS